MWFSKNIANDFFRGLMLMFLLKMCRCLSKCFYYVLTELLEIIIKRHFKDLHPFHCCTSETKNHIKVGWGVNIMRSRSDTRTMGKFLLNRHKIVEKPSLLSLYRNFHFRSLSSYYIHKHIYSADKTRVSLGIIKCKHTLQEQHKTSNNTKYFLKIRDPSHHKCVSHAIKFINTTCPSESK